jgi:hypothetical protein
VKNIIKLTAVILILSMVCVLFTNCALTYGAKLLEGNAEDLINPEFYNENKLHSAFYRNDPSDSDEKQFVDPSYPRTRSFIIRSQEEYNVIFSEKADFEVDFDKKMLIVLTYAPTAKSLPVEIANMTLDNGTLFVQLETMSPHPPWRLFGAGGLPRQRYVVIEMKATDVKNVEFDVKYYGYNFDSFF